MHTYPEPGAATTELMTGLIDLLAADEIVMPRSRNRRPREANKRYIFSCGKKVGVGGGIQDKNNG